MVLRDAGDHGVAKLDGSPLFAFECEQCSGTCGGFAVELEYAIAEVLFEEPRPVLADAQSSFRVVHEFNAELDFHNIDRA